MTDENTTALPYRNGIRVAPEEPTEPLPDLLTVRYDELVARDRAEWEAHVKTPAWWLEHVARHTLARSKSNPAANPPDFRTAHPSWRPLRNSMLWTVFLGVSWIVAYKITTEMPCYNPARMASLICVGEAVLAACIAVAEKEDFRWSLKHVLLVPMSLYLTLKEYIAWKRWTKSGERWTGTRLDWNADQAITSLAATFREETIERHAKDLADLRSREARCREEAANAHKRIQAYERQRDELKSKNATIGEQIERSIEVERERAAGLLAKADQLADIASDGERRLEALKQAIDTYESLQRSRYALRDAGLLDMDNTNDLVQQEIARIELLKLRALLNRVEAVFRDQSTWQTATREDDLPMQIDAATTRAAAR